MNIEMENVREYAEEMPVSLIKHEDNGRLVVLALNESGHNCTYVDLDDLLQWVRTNRPDLLELKGGNTLTELLLLKRSVDGLNGRTWDASKHLEYENKISALVDEKKI